MKQLKSKVLCAGIGFLLIACSSKTPNETSSASKTEVSSVKKSAPSASNESALQVPHEYRDWKLSDTFEPLPQLFIYRYTHAPSGLELLLSPKPGIQVVAYVTSYNVGSRYEKKNRTGLAHLFEHMMFRGTESFPQPFKTLSEWGDSFNAYTSFDLTLYHQIVPAKVMPEMIKFEAERMRKLKIDEAGFNTERGAVVSERKMRTEDSPFGRLHWELHMNSYDVHPYRVGPIGWQEDLNATTFQDALDFYKRFYAPNRAVISMVGDFEILETLKILDTHYGSFKRESWIEPKISQEAPRKSHRRKVITMKSESILIAESTLGKRMHDSGIYADSLFCYLIADDKIGYLHTELVESGIARNVNADCSPNMDRGLNTLYVVGNPQVSLKVLEEKYESALKGFAKWLTEDKVEKAKMYYLAGQWASLRSPGELAEQIARSSTTTGDPLFDFKFLAVAQKVKFEDVRSAFLAWQKSFKTRVIVVPGEKNTPFTKR